MEISSSAHRELDGHEPQKVAVFTAWPYANGPRHLGHGASLVPGDAIARYHRAKGDDVLMVSGTDEYGTPNVIAAESAGIPVADYVAQMNETIRHDFEALNMGYDWFTRTTTAVHEANAQEMFSNLVDNGYLEKTTMLGSFDSETCQSLPDRYVEGGCPSCGNNTRGDQCEACNALLDPHELINPHSRLTGNAVKFQDTEHWFLQLDSLAPDVKEWVMNNQGLRPNAKTSSLNQIEELRPRAITRDMEWGVPLPEDHTIKADTTKVMYVWFEAVTGYLSASKEWAEASGNPEAWKEWWKNDDARHIYAMGKDNVPFHTIIWPAMLMGVSKDDDGPLHLPDQIASTEYLTLGEGKFSSSRGNVIYLKDLVDAAGVDATRFYLLSSGPETRDKTFSVDEFVTVNNSELLSKWGNLAQRVLTLSAKQFNGSVPDIDRGDISSDDRRFLNGVMDTYEVAGEQIEDARIASAVRTVMNLAMRTNKYLNEREPWKTAKIDRDATARSLYSSLVAVDNLSRLLAPIMPSSSQKVHERLGYDGSLSGIIQHVQLPDHTVLTGDYSMTANTWSYTEIPSSQSITPGEHLFKKLDGAELTDTLIQKAKER